MKILIILTVLLISITACDKTDNITKEAIQERVEAAQKAISKDFLTPESVSFKDVYYNVDWQAVCGWIKHKNSYGSYTEFNEFIYTNGSYTERLLYADADKKDNYFLEMWNEVCGK